MANILFVCTGNVFRSMIAEKCFKDYAQKNKITDFYADSAGIKTTVQKPQYSTIQRLNFYGINAKNHQYKQLTKGLIFNQDLVIAMNLDHQNFIEQYFNIKVPLFNEIAYNKNEGVLDFHKYNPKINNLLDKKKNREIKEYAYFLVDYIYKSTPYLFKNINKRIKNLRNNEQ